MRHEASCSQMEAENNSKNKDFTFFTRVLEGPGGHATGSGVVVVTGFGPGSGITEGGDPSIQEG